MDILRFEDVTQASSGNEAMAKVNSEIFDCILVDSCLEDMLGCELIKYIRNDKTIEDMAIIAVHNDDQQHLIENTRNAGASGIINRPFSAGIIQQQILAEVKDNAWK